MSWVTVREAIRVAVAQCIEADTAAGGPVEWVDRALANRWTGADDEPWADLRLTPNARGYRGEIRYELDVDTDSLVEYHVNHRHFSVTVLVGTESQEPGASAVDIADQIPGRLKHSSILSGLQAAKVAVRDIGPVIDATYTDAEGRAASQAAVELYLSTVLEWAPAVPTGDYFSSVEGSGADGGDLEGAEFGPVTAP